MSILKISEFTKKASNIEESFLESNKFPHFHIFCDAITLEDPKIAKKAEKTIVKYLRQFIANESKAYNVDTLSKAINYANQKTQQDLLNYQGKYKVSVLIVAENYLTNEKGVLEGEILAVGLGDIRLYNVEQEKLEILFDPQPQALNLSLKERFLSLNKVIGCSHNLNIRHILHRRTQFNLLLASYGLYSQSPEKNLILLSTLPADNTNKHLSKLITSLKSHTHSLAFISSTLEEPQLNLLQSLDTAVQQPLKIPSHRWSNLKKIAFTAGITMLAILSVISIQLTMKENQVYHPEPVHASSAQLSATKPKVPFKPSLKENVPPEALTTYLENENQRQAQVIQDLQNKLRNKNRALRDLQAKLRDHESIWTVKMYSEHIEENNTKPLEKV